jgi:hypothetical protein
LPLKKRHNSMDINNSQCPAKASLLETDQDDEVGCRRVWEVRPVGMEGKGVAVRRVPPLRTRVASHSYCVLHVSVGPLRNGSEAHAKRPQDCVYDVLAFWEVPPEEVGNDRQGW